MTWSVLFHEEFDAQFVGLGADAQDNLLKSDEVKTMARSIDEVIAGLPKARRERVEAKAARLARDMIEHADSLGDIRKAMSKTQTDIARALGVGQVAVAQLEKRSDLLLSTLQRYVRATGAELSLVVHTRDGADIVLESLGDLASRGSAAAKARRATGARTAGRRAVTARAK